MDLSQRVKLANQASHGLTSSPADSPASPLARRENERAREIAANSGRKCFELFKLSGPAGWWQKTFMDLLLTRAENFSTRYTVTWKAKVTKRSRRLFFQLAPSARRTEWIAYGLWPTPRSAGQNDSAREENRTGNRHAGDDLSTAVMKKMWATPRVDDSKNNGTQSQLERNGPALNAQLGGQLNPTWVEWLMGYPSEWTVLKDSETPSSRKSRS